MNPTPPSRKPVHTRRVTCTGYVRTDGLLDIEGEMQDITPEQTDLLFKIVPPGGTIHHMRIVMTVDSALVIHSVTARIQTGPTDYCAEIESAYAGLKGLQISAGFRQQIKAVVGSIKGCTHLTELLGPMATTAMQTRFALARAARNGRWPAEGDGPLPRPPMVDSCHTYRMDGEAVKMLWPENRRATPSEPPGRAS